MRKSSVEQVNGALKSEAEAVLVGVKQVAQALNDLKSLADLPPTS